MIKFTSFYSRLFSLMMAALLVLVSACQQDDPTPINGSGIAGENEKVNAWIEENMNFWYLWNDQLPATPDKNADPETFFKSLLSSEDRFSWIQDSYKELLNSLQGITMEAGYEFVLYREQEGSSNLIAQILYIKPGSPAENAGLKRGDVITQINNETITTSNYQTLLKDIHENHSLEYKPLLIDAKKFDAPKSISLNVVEFSENPNHMSTVIESGERKVGYYVYNFFASGTDANEKLYDTQMESIFADFKAKGITDVILDLRFNSGGSEAAAANLASLIGSGVDNSKTFAQRTYNPQVEKEIVGDPKLGQSYLTTKFISKASNVGSLLTGGRVYILTSSRTASASELVINALKPFMEVFLIGDVTYGKNVGSISLYDEEDDSNSWGLQPIVVKVSNSLGQSDYSAGFSPDIEDLDNSLYIFPLGDEREALLSHALARITGAAVNGRATARKESKEIIGHSLDANRRSFSLIIDQKNLHFRSKEK